MNLVISFNSFTINDTAVQDWWGFLNAECKSQKFKPVRAVVLYVGIRKGCLNPDADASSTYALWLQVEPSHVQTRTGWGQGGLRMGPESDW